MVIGNIIGNMINICHNDKKIGYLLEFKMHLKKAVILMSLLYYTKSYLMSQK